MGLTIGGAMSESPAACGAPEVWGGRSTRETTDERPLTDDR
jgi:hypothetical protein